MNQEFIEARNLADWICQKGILRERESYFEKVEGEEATYKAVTKYPPPFEARPDEYLKRAKEDRKNDDNMSLVSCLTNCKRAIDCQIDYLLFAVGLYPLSKKGGKKWRFPKKIEIINTLGILAPDILKKVNHLRNELEHEYKIPDPKRAADYCDITELFLESTSQFDWKLLESEIFIFESTESSDKGRVAVHVDREHGFIELKPESLPSNNPVRIKASENVEYMKIWKWIVWSVKNLVI